MKTAHSPLSMLERASLNRGSAFAMILLAALLAFEIFNYSTTDFALTDLLGKELKFLGIRWATILSLAFCGIDFAGIARLFTPEQGADEPAEVGYLFGAWILAAIMNAMLTWWGVSVSLLNRNLLASAVIPQDVLANNVPIFIAGLVLVIRVLIIGTFSVAGERIFSVADVRSFSEQEIARRPPVANPQPVSNFRPQSYQPNNRQSPSYHPIGFSAKTTDKRR